MAYGTLPDSNVGPSVSEVQKPIRDPAFLYGTPRDKRCIGVFVDEGTFEIGNGSGSEENGWLPISESLGRVNFVVFGVHDLY